MRYNYQSLLKNWTVEYTTDVVSPESASTWSQLVDEYPDSLYAEPARFRLAVLALRQGEVVRAERLLEQLLSMSQTLGRGGTSSKPAESMITLADMFTEPQQANVPPVDLFSLVEQTQELLELVRQNGRDPRFGAEPLSQLMRLDPYHPKYRDHLLEMAIKFSGSQLHDNLLVRYALTDPDPQQRREMLERYSELFAGKDAGAEALLELGRLLQAWGLANMDPKAHAMAKNCYTVLVRRYPKSIFAVQAQANLEHVETVARQFCVK